jgi:hypothetical protein
MGNKGEVEGKSSISSGGSGPEKFPVEGLGADSSNPDEEE